ncbi:MAG: hypothetical protein BMS9Abin05_1849 [Rhodothermia bacterium]|nr:MAG: hypothetical protein BMS9Abin05_1849 [Rhodothermia bacterium]
MLNPDYAEMLSALSDAGAEYIVVGAFALAAHGNPRSTGDIDILVRPTSENAERVMAALDHFGAPLSQISHLDFLKEDTVFQIGVTPRRIDLLTALEGVDDFGEAWDSHVLAIVDGMEIPVLGRDILIKNKRALARPQDLADVAWLEANSE